MKHLFGNRTGRKFQFLTFLVGTVLYLTIFWGCSGSGTQTEAPGEAQPARSPSPSVPEFEFAASTDFSKFGHDNPQHVRLPCLLCHKRDDNSTAPKFSGHLPCSGCHVQQFADKNNAICTICHTDAVTGALRSFPPLKTFGAVFDHGKHVRETNCATCHSPNRRGAGFSMPAGSAAHATCFKCHSPDKEIGGRNIGSCDVCHTLGGDRLGNSGSKAYAVNFDHAKHIKGGKLGCSACHSVRAGSGFGQVTQPVAAMHAAAGRGFSCATCHNDKRAFGTADFGNCKRCHTGGSFKF